MTDAEATNKIRQLLLLGNTQQEIAEMIGITRQTIIVRLRKNNWKKSEKFVIKQL